MELSRFGERRKGEQQFEQLRNPALPSAGCGYSSCPDRLTTMEEQRLVGRGAMVRDCVHSSELIDAPSGCEGTA